MTLKAILLLCFIAVCYSFPSDGLLSNAMLDDIFGVKPDPTEAQPVDHTEGVLDGGITSIDSKPCSEIEVASHVCVPYYLCDVNHQDEALDKKPLALINAYCSSYIELCCDERYVIKDFHPHTKDPGMIEATKFPPTSA